MQSVSVAFVEAHPNLQAQAVELNAKAPDLHGLKMDIKDVRILFESDNVAVTSTASQDGCA